MNPNQPTPSQLETMYPQMYRTIFLKINPFNGNKIQPMMSNFVVGVPPDGMKVLDQKLINAIGRTYAMVSTSFW